MQGRSRIICKNSSKYKVRQYVTLTIMAILTVSMYFLDYYYLKTDRGLPRFVFITCTSIGIFLVWQRLFRKIEIVGTCGVSRWMGEKRFYVTDVKIAYYGSLMSMIDDVFFIEFKNYKKFVFHVAETDENITQLKGAINNPLKGYVVEPDIEKKYRRKKGALLKQKYEVGILLKYGQEIKNAEIVGGMDLRFGKVIPIYEFDDSKGKHMTWGVQRMKLEEMESRLHKKCSIYYAPGKVGGVMEVKQYQR